MRVLIAFDKFKHALDARAACEAAAGALRQKHPDWTLDLCPLTDGGEGFTETLTASAGGKLETIEVAGPRGGAAAAAIGLVSAQSLTGPVRERLSLPAHATVAIIDLASASGLALLEPADRDPWHTTTGGTGQLLLHAARARADVILLGVGGSATNDLGAGALAALGVRFLDAFGTEMHPPVPAKWERIVSVEGNVTLPPLFIACDVTNPLLGQRGATAIFGPQKGLPPTDVLRLDQLARRLAGILCDHFGRPRELADTPGTGAAGGIPFGLMVAANARLVPGYSLVADWLNLPARLAAADLVLTGEGRFDATSLGGKAPGMLVTQARRLGKSAHVFAGSLGIPEDKMHHAITPADMALADALPQTARLLSAAIARAL